MAYKKKETTAAGRPKATYNKKTREWALLGDFVTQKGAKRYMEILDGLDDEAFMDRYERILSYFKPKKMNSVMDLQTEFKIEVVNADDKVVEEITDEIKND